MTQKVYVSHVSRFVGPEVCTGLRQAKMFWRSFRRHPRLTNGGHALIADAYLCLHLSWSPSLLSRWFRCSSRRTSTGRSFPAVFISKSDISYLHNSFENRVIYDIGSVSTRTANNIYDFISRVSFNVPA